MAMSPNETALQEATLEASPIEEPYSIYTRHEKWFIVTMVAIAGLYSPLPANIYFPAIPTLAVEFGQSIEALNQSVTTYLIFQGVSPMLWGPLSDRYGRRPVFLICLAILIGSCIGLALCPTSAYWLLLVLRCLQAGGCASTIALGMGVCGDITVPEERGGFVGFFNLGPMLAPCIGPAIGGVLSENLGWRSIFWFLVVMAVQDTDFISFLPETLRAIAGNGSIPMAGIHRALVPLVGPKGKRPDDMPAAARQKTSINPFPIFALPDIVITLIFTGIVYAVNYTVTSTISSAFADVYPWLSETVLGLSYLPTGLGMILGSTFVGKLLDWDYARIKKQLAESGSASDFPKERARLRTMPAHLAIFVMALVGWGWCIEAKTPMAAPLVLQVILGWTSISILNTTMTLNVDILQKRSSAATACTNLVRCLLAAVLVSVIERMTSRLGYGWTYVLLGAICLSMLPLFYVVMKFGPRWRKKREEKEELQ
ncbi:major facilitator superfamily transporter multidrug resistance [Dactylonectria estremocensis]|uniref:Major facilitator superfamily transporter multidrug resistance n=1 Tax=Dactylonectria estremocensis TaxID=1079267 RepID=A0A9P9J1D7_9HYPO|nr:major facilitator superfamily transporter multidrug resistance [Dactylonectria estremocensis]